MAIPTSLPASAAPFRLSFLWRWWYDPVRRFRVLTASALACLFGVGLGYGAWTRVCAAERCPSIARLRGDSKRGQLQTSKVYAADGRLITELGIEARRRLLDEAAPLEFAEDVVSAHAANRTKPPRYWQALASARPLH